MMIRACEVFLFVFSLTFVCVQKGVVVGSADVSALIAQLELLLIFLWSGRAAVGTGMSACVGGGLGVAVGIAAVATHNAAAASAAAATVSDAIRNSDRDSVGHATVSEMIRWLW